MSKSVTKELRCRYIARRNVEIMRFLSDALDLFRVFVTDLDILRLIVSRTESAKPSDHLAQHAGAPEAPRPADAQLDAGPEGGFHQHRRPTPPITAYI